MRGACAGLPLLGQERRVVEVAVVLGLLVHQAHAVVERQARRHLPVVLRVPLVVVRDVHALGPPRRLAVGVEHADRRVGERIAGVDRVVGVVLEADLPQEVAGAAALVAVEVVVPELERVGAVQLGHAHVDVRHPRVEDEVAERPDVVRRRVGDPAHPGERRHRQTRACRPTPSDRRCSGFRRPACWWP